MLYRTRDSYNCKEVCMFIMMLHVRLHFTVPDLITMISVKCVLYFPNFFCYLAWVYILSLIFHFQMCGVKTPTPLTS